MLSNQNLIQQWTITRDYYQARHACKKKLCRIYTHIWNNASPAFQWLGEGPITICH